MNRFKNQILLAAGFAVLAGVISGVTAAPAIAQAIKAALVKNVDEPGRTPFQVRLSCGNGSTTACNGTSAAIPLGKRLVIQHVSVKIDTLPAGSTVEFLDLSSPEGELYIHPELNSSGFGFDHYVGNANGPLFVDEGQQMRLHGQASGTGMILQGTVTGYLVDLHI